MKKINVTIKGISPLLMHRFPSEPIEAIEKKSKEEQAEIACYRTLEGELYIPGVAVTRALVNGATYSKGKGRASLQKQAAACLFIDKEYLILDSQKYIIDERAVVVPATKGRIMRYRPRFDAWLVSFELHYDETLLTENQVRQIVDSTGSRVGILDFRPEHKGNCGRFVVTEWR